MLTTTIEALSPKVGDRIRILFDAWYWATVIVVDKKDKSIPYMVGWKAGENGPNNVSNIGSGSVSLDPLMPNWDSNHCDKVTDLSVYIKDAWVPWDCKVEMIDTVISAPVQSGMFCADPYCRTYNQYAVANMPDGTTYKCYQCRQRKQY